MKDVNEIIQNKPRLGSVKFFGVCNNCGGVVDITNFLSPEQKQNYVKKLGIIFDGSNAVCKFFPLLDYCITCGA